MVNTNPKGIIESERFCTHYVMLAKAGIQEFYLWIPASAGMTNKSELDLSRLEIGVLL
jgi:hypothetical protein